MKQPRLRDVRAVIPRELFTADNYRAFWFLTRTLFVLAMSTAIAYMTMIRGWWWLYPLNWLVTGTVFFGLFEVAHNCGHHAYFSSKNANRVCGHFAALPLIYPFTQWKLWHDAHHRRPNSTAQTLYHQFKGQMCLRLDTAFSPMTKQEVEQARISNPLALFFYYISRAFTPLAVLMTPYILTVHFARELRPLDRRACKQSLGFTLIAVPLSMGGIVLMTGTWFSIVHLWLMPLCVYACWLAYYALLQHTGEDIPVFCDTEWTTSAQFLAVANTRTPRWISWFHGGGEFHAIHHIAPTIPNYNLPAAYRAIKSSEYAEYIRDVPFSLIHFIHVQRMCQIWDHGTSRYRTFASVRTDSDQAE